MNVAVNIVLLSSETVSKSIIFLTINNAEGFLQAESD